MSKTTSGGRGPSQENKLLERAVNEVILKLKRRDIVGSGAVAISTAELLRTFVTRGRFSVVRELLDIIRRVGRRLVAARESELCIGNIVRRVLFIIRVNTQVFLRENEKKDLRMDLSDQVDVDLSLSLMKLLDNQQEDQGGDLDTPISKELKGMFIEEITQLMDEVKNVSHSIADKACDHVFSGETILTYGVSATVLAFLKEAAKIRTFQLIVVESGPSYLGHKQATQLAEAGIETTCITDSAVFAMMRVVNKVIIGTHAVMANGGCIAYSGGANITVAAQHYSVPVVVVTGLHKLSPLYAMDQDTFNEQWSPQQILDFQEGWESIQVENPAYDYIDPTLVALFITNIGAHAPAYMYRLLAESYDSRDYELGETEED